MNSFSFSARIPNRETFKDNAMVADLEKMVDDRTSELVRANEELRREVSELKWTEERLLIYQKRIRSLCSELFMVEEKERRRFATRLHDHIGQTLAVSKIKLSSLRNSVSSFSTSVLDEVNGFIEQAIQDTRALAFDLCPLILYELGLETAIEWLVEQFQHEYGLMVEFENKASRLILDEGSKVLVFRAVRELLTNVVKHAKASKVRVFLYENGDCLKIDIEDDGVGFNIREIESVNGIKRFGIFNIRERLKHIGGCLVIDSRLGVGTLSTLQMNMKTAGCPKTQQF